ncbi:MAG: orotate phosphoribosyltransferase [Candidatus Sericytochromatia bacterium]|nr:orotate phosphoribosyltransferase [Candidatus Sericytochromatia bacterium]
MPSSPFAAELTQRLLQTEALLEGHFALSSGLHSPRYVQCARLLQHPPQAAWAAEALARQMETPCDVVVGPALGGVIIAHELARALQVRALFTERVEGAMMLRRGFTLAPGERVLIVEDVITTGGSAAEAAACVRALGAEVVGYACLVDRGGAGGLDAPCQALLALSVPTFAPADCPACRAGEPVIKPGSRPQASVEPAR